jgi:uncharacterized membrane protein YdjX (TVP38/TMEM64 family)
MKVFVLSAGAFGTPPATFLAIMALGRIPRYFGLAWLGREYGAQSAAWLKGHGREFGLGALALVILCYLLIKVIERFYNAPGREPVN